MQLVVKRTQIYNKCITTCVTLLDCVSCPSHGLYIPCSCGQPQFYWGGAGGLGMALVWLEATKRLWHYIPLYHHHHHHYCSIKLTIAIQQ